MANDSSSTQDAPQPDDASWKQIVLKHQNPSRGRALWQITDTLGPYGALWYLMKLSLSISWWLACCRWPFWPDCFWCGCS